MKGRTGGIGIRDPAKRTLTIKPQAHLKYILAILLERCQQPETLEQFKDRTGRSFSFTKFKILAHRH